MSIALPRTGMVKQDHAAVVERADVPRSRFITRTTRKQTQNAGRICPIFWDEAVPGDHLKYDLTALIRMSTPINPIFSNIEADIFVFAIPERLLWLGFERFMGEQNSPSDDVSSPQMPAMTLTQADLASAVGSVADYLGLPIGQLAVGGSITVRASPFRAVWTVWDEWFRDQNLQARQGPSNGNWGDGPDAASYATTSPPMRAKSHDYFAGSLPWTQKFTAPTVPVAGFAPVIGIGFSADTGILTTDQVVRQTQPYGGNPNPFPTDTFNPRMPGNSASIQIDALYNGTNYGPQIYADLSSVSGVSINQLRQAVQVQRLLERDARGGTRYVESVFGHWGIQPEDYRVSRPEYIGGGRALVEVTPVAQTAPVAGVSPLGNIGAAATSVVRARASYMAREHCIVMGFLVLRQEQVYQQGIAAKWWRRARLDFPFPALMQLGEQAILRRELYARGDSGDTTVFGYTPRYEEFRQHYSDVAGRFRSTVATPLDVWHLAENFSSAPVLGATFIQVDQLAYDRVLSIGATARTNTQQFLADVLIERDFTRPFPIFGTPVGMGRY